MRDYVDVEEVEPLELKGKAERVPAYRLVGVHDDADRPRRRDAPLVGREEELELLRAQVREAVDGRVCRLATVVGEAGVGKSRLLDELVAGLGEGFRILRGRCLPYGDGITFWPLAEAVRDAAQIAERDTTEEALEKLAALTSDPEVTERVASAIGLSAASFPVEELVWGARRLLECLGREQPVLVLFDDIHWAEPTFLELIEQVVEHASDSQLVVICTARHEFVERNSDFSTEGGAVRILLERLSEADAAAVAGHLLGMAELNQNIRDRIVAAAEGNPLFIEQLLSMLIDDGAIVFEDGAWRAAATIGDFAVPPTIHALLAARLDALGSEERAVIEPASVIGQLFVHDAVHHLAPEYVRPELGSHLVKLTDKQLILRDSTRLDEDAFRFHHILIRDTAYDGILKRARANFHIAFVEWADSVNREGATSTRRSSATTSSRLIGTCPSSARSTTTAARWGPTVPGDLPLQGGARSPEATSLLLRTSSAAPLLCYRTTRRTGSSSSPSTARRCSRSAASRMPRRSWRPRSGRPPPPGCLA